VTATHHGEQSVWQALVAARCDEVRHAGRWRRPRPFDASGPIGVMTDDGRKVVSFASNDYLGFSAHPAVAEAAAQAIARWGTGAGASRLVTGSRPVHHQLEAELAAHAGCQRAVLFPTGFAANLGVLTSFGERGVLVCSDEYNHASIVDGARLCRAEVAVYPHRDLEALEKLVAGAGGPVLVVSDLVFSMDGDIAPVEELAALCRGQGALLVLDEAHAVLGPDPAPHLKDTDVLRVGTLSKTLGALGGYVAGPASFVELVENRARSYIFTTAPTPADTAAALAALRLLHAPEGESRRQRLRAHVQRIAPGHPSPIVPVILGDEAAAVAASDALLERGLWVPAIRPPTVPPGSARLRVTLSAAHGEDDVEQLARALAELAASAARAETAPASRPGATPRPPG